MFEDDICWCVSSIREGAYGCEHKDCFRHMSHRKTPKDGPDIFTMASLKHTSYCPYYEEEE